MGLFNAVMALSGAADTDLIEQESLARHTSYRIGGKADLFLVCHSYHALRRALDVLTEEDVPWVIIGKGSNLLVADEGYRGAVVTLGREFSRMICADDGVTLTVGAGVILARLVNEALSRGLTGLEFAVGIPGTVGGAVSMNAGTRDEWIGRRVRDLVVLEPGSGMRRYAGGEIDWGYRMTTLPSTSIILEATFSLLPATREAIAADTDARLRRRRSSQPLSLPSCGSVFRNPPDRSVGALIESCGLSGATQGGAQISTEHANFIVNRGGATAADVLALIGAAHDAVLARYGIDLTCEVKLLGFGR